MPPHCKFWVFSTDSHVITECYSNGRGHTQLKGALLLPRIPDEDAAGNQASKESTVV